MKNTLKKLLQTGQWLSLAQWLALAWIALWFVYFSYFWSHSLWFDDRGNVQVGNVNMWGDWAVHFTMGSHMAYRDLIPTQSPLLIGAEFGYPFVADGLSAALVRLGVPFFSAFLLPSFVFSISTIVVLLLFYRKVLGGWAIAILASFFFLCNGGIGFTQYFRDISQSATPWVTALNPPHEYTNIEPEFVRWISVVQSMIIPQRAFNLGFPIALMALTAVWILMEQRDPKKSEKSLPLSQTKKRILLGVAILGLGLSPVLHTHSFLVAFVLLAVWSVGDVLLAWSSPQRWRVIGQWMLIALGTSLIALPLLQRFFFGHVTETFWKWQPGWYAYKNPNLNWFYFWFLNWGVVPLLALGGWLYLIKQKTTARERWHLFFIFVPFFILFAALNLILFQPFIWDNTKLLVWVSVGFSGLAAVAVKAMWHADFPVTFFQPLVIAIFKASALLLILLSTFAGTIDALRVIRFPVHTHQMYSHEEMELSRWTLVATDPYSVWLTGDQHNHWLYNLTGRQPLLVFRGWLWTHGYQYYTVEADTTTMLQHPELAGELFAQYGVDYAVIGPNELRGWRANEDAFRQLFPLVRQTENYRIYAISASDEALNDE